MSAISSFDPDHPQIQWRPERHAEGYVPDFDIDFDLGSQGELFVIDLLKSIGTDRIEVKTDAKARETGKVFLEISCRGRPSGIITSKADYWALVIPGDFVIIAKAAALRDLAHREWVRGEVREGGKSGSHPTVGVTPSLQRLVTFLRNWEADR